MDGSFCECGKKGPCEAEELQEGCSGRSTQHPDPHKLSGHAGT